MGTHNDNGKHSQDEMNRQRRDERGGDAGQHQDKSGQQGGQSDRQIDDNQDDLGRDVNDPDKTSNEINKGV